MRRRAAFEQSGLRIADVVVASVLTLLLTAYFAFMCVLQLGFLEEHVRNCLHQTQPEPDAAWVCSGNHITIFRWFGWSSYLVWLVIVWGGIAVSLRRGWWLIIWPLLGIVLIIGIQVVELWASN